MVEVKLTGDIARQLDAYQKHIQEEIIRPAAQAGAQVFYDEIKVRVPVGKPRKYKGKQISGGTLKAAIYQVFSKKESSDTKKVYHLSWNHQKAPHGHLIEFGTVRAPAYPFIRPSFEAKKDAAIRAVLDELRVRLDSYGGA